jgi:hypothetical protein
LQYITIITLANCRKSCKKCSHTRPCERCVKYNLSGCVDAPVRPRRKQQLSTKLSSNNLLINLAETSRSDDVLDESSVTTISMLSTVNATAGVKRMQSINKRNQDKSETEGLGSELNLVACQDDTTDEDDQPHVPVIDELFTTSLTILSRDTILSAQSPIFKEIVLPLPPSLKNSIRKKQEV